MASAWVNRVIILLSYAGIFVAGVLTVAAFGGLSVPCGVASGCDIVQSHPSSKLFGIPVAVLGLATYVMISSLAILRTVMPEIHWHKLARLGTGLAALGFAFSIYLTVISMTDIKATCAWCLASAGLMGGLFFAHGALLTIGRPEKTRDGIAPGLGGLSFILAIGGIGMTVRQMDAAVDLAVRQVRADSVSREALMPPDARSMGNKDAKVLLVEFADFLCPTCRRTHETVKRLVDSSKGTIRYGFRHMPYFEIAGHETTLAAHMLSELAASQGKFFEFLEAGFDPANNERVKSLDGLVEIAKEVGLDAVRAHKIAYGEDISFLDVVHADREYGTSLAIQSTPTFIVMAGDAPAKAFTNRNIEQRLTSPPISDHWSH